MLVEFDTYTNAEGMPTRHNGRMRTKVFVVDARGISVSLDNSFEA